MDELVTLVAQKVGISDDMAQTAVSTVIGYVKQKLPDPIAGQLESLLASGGEGLDLDDLTGGLGSLLGR
jgi:hypothetical protein